MAYYKVVELDEQETTDLHEQIYYLISLGIHVGLCNDLYLQRDLEEF